MKNKKCLSVLLTVVMLLSAFNFAAFAAATDIQKGDVNQDNKITVVDAKWILQSIAGAKSFDDSVKAAADVNSDGKITVVDAKWVLQAVAGIRYLYDVYPEFEGIPDFGALYGVEPETIEYYDDEYELSNESDYYHVEYIYSISSMPESFELDKYFNLLLSIGYVKCSYEEFFDEDTGLNLIVKDFYNPNTCLDVIVCYNEEENLIRISFFPIFMLSYSDFNAPDIGLEYGVEYDNWYGDQYDSFCTYSYNLTALKNAGYTYESFKELCEKNGFSFYESHEELDENTHSGDAQFINTSENTILEINYYEENEYFEVKIYCITDYGKGELPDFGEFANVNCGNLSYAINGVTYGYNVNEFDASLIDSYKVLIADSGYAFDDSYEYVSDGVVVRIDTYYNESINSWITFIKGSDPDMFYIDIHISAYSFTEG